MGIRYGDVAKYGLIDSSLLNHIKSKCECGNEIEFSDNLKDNYCSNKYCYVSIGKRLNNMATQLGVKGWDDETSKMFCKRFNIKSPYQVFQIEKAIKEGLEYTEIEDFEKKALDLCNKNNRKIELWRAIEIGGINNVSEYARDLFKGYECISVFLNDLDKNGLELIAERLNTDNKVNKLILSAKIYSSIMDSKDELIYCNEVFEIKSDEADKIRIAICGNVTGFSDNEFIEFISNRYNNNVTFIKNPLMNNDTDVLIVENENKSSISSIYKCHKAEEINKSFRQNGIEKGEFFEDEIDDYLLESDIKRIGEAVAILTSKELISKLDEAYL